MSIINDVRMIQPQVQHIMYIAKLTDTNTPHHNNKSGLRGNNRRGLGINREIKVGIKVRGDG